MNLLYILEPGIYQAWKLIQYIGIRREARQRINAVQCSRVIYLSLYLIIKLCLFVQRTGRLRIATPACCFNIFGSIFGVVFCFLIKKLILGCKTIWQRWESFYDQFEVWVHFPIWTKEKHLFLVNCTLVWSEFFK